MTPLIRSACLTGYTPLAESAGLDAYAMLSEAGIDRACLANPDVKISAVAFARLISASARASGWHDFGLRLVETRQLSVLGPLALAVREQATGRKALEMLCLRMSLHSESMLLWIQEEGGLCILHIEVRGRGQELVQQATEMTACTTYRHLQQLMPQGWSAREVCFAHAAPAHLTTHRRIFGKRIEFNAQFSGIVCLAADLDAPRQTDPTLELYARQYLDSIRALPTRTTAEQVRQLALALMPSGRCQLNQIARSMGVDVRTVRRRLNDEQVSFTSLLDALRKDMVFKYLDAPGRQLSEVAYLLGFSSLSVFSHWFRKHFASSATDWRAVASGTQ